MSTWLEIVIKTLVEIRQSDEKTQEYYRYDNGISLHMIKKILGADESQWRYIRNALKRGVEQKKIIKTREKYRVDWW